MNERDPWPFGDAIRAARGRRSTRSVAKLADLSEGRWRQLENGYASAGNGIEVPARPKPDTAVAMARAVGVDPAEALRLAGFDPVDHDHLLLGEEASLTGLKTLAPSFVEQPQPGIDPRRGFSDLYTPPAPGVFISYATADADLVVEAAFLERQLESAVAQEQAARDAFVRSQMTTQATAELAEMARAELRAAVAALPAEQAKQIAQLMVSLEEIETHLAVEQRSKAVMEAALMRARHEREQIEERHRQVRDRRNEVVHARDAAEATTDLALAARRAKEPTAAQRRAEADAAIEMDPP